MIDHGMPECMRLLPPQTMAALRALDWHARRRKRGALTGRHPSPDKGASVEFAEHREYTAGDDIRTLDWRVMARSDRAVIRQYLEETNLRLTLAVDVSGSMAYAGEHAAEAEGRRLSKLGHAKRLAAALAYFFVQRGDAAGLVTFDNRARARIPAANRASQVRRILEALDGAKPGVDSDAGPVLHRVAEQIPGRGLVVIFSDLFDDPERVAKALHHFGHRGHELAVFHILAREELEFPFREFRQFRDLESVVPMMQVDPQAVRAEYLSRLRRFLDRVREVCGQLRADYVPVDTGIPVAEVLTNYLGGRGR